MKNSEGFGIGTLACYENLEQVGEGTYGHVYRAKDRRNGEVVALKRLIIHKEGSGFPLCAVREIKFLKSLRHKNIVYLKDVVTSKGYESLEPAAKPDTKQDPNKVADAKKQAENTQGEEDGRDILKLCGNLYFVFEFLEHDLGGLIDARYQFPTRAIKSIMKQLFEVLEFLHERKIIHRDIKSSNILLSNYHQVKLADFGLARSIPSALDSFGGGLSIGGGGRGNGEMTNNVITIWYRPPELLLGTTKYSTAVDIWSAACVGAELELIRPLFPGKTELEQLEIIFRTIGSPNEETWPGLSKFPHYEKMLKPMMTYANTMKSSSMRLSENMISLLERLLVADPSRRGSARVALTNRYFHTPPLPPNDPMELGCLQISPGMTFHEYKTKLERKQKEQKEREAATAAMTTTAITATTTVSVPVSVSVNSSTVSSNTNTVVGPTGGNIGGVVGNGMGLDGGFLHFHGTNNYTSAETRGAGTTSGYSSSGAGGYSHKKAYYGGHSHQSHYHNYPPQQPPQPSHYPPPSVVYPVQSGYGGAYVPSTTAAPPTSAPYSNAPRGNGGYGNNTSYPSTSSTSNNAQYSNKKRGFERM